MAKNSTHHSISHTHKVAMVSIYDNMEKYCGGSGFHADHKPYDYPQIKRKVKKNSNV